MGWVATKFLWLYKGDIGSQILKNVLNYPWDWNTSQQKAVENPKDVAIPIDPVEGSSEAFLTKHPVTGYNSKIELL